MSVEMRGTRTNGLVPTVRPTIVAAVGGTGVAAAKYTIASVKELLGHTPDWLAVRAFDTDAQDNRAPRLKNQFEFVQLSDFNVRAVLDAVRDKAEFRHWREWLPPLLSAQQISTGVGGLRPKGRLCYCHKRDDVKIAIQSALGRIRNSSNARELNRTDGLVVDVSGGIDIHIISSVCGGTGSSMFLDLAYDIRSWANSFTTGDVTITGHLVLPGAFARKPVLTSVLEANAYAALQELDRFMRGDRKDPWRMQYGASDTVESSAPPFDYCYLLDGVGPSGVADVDEIVSVIGDMIAQMTLGAVGAKLKSQIRNTTDTVLSRTDQKDRPCCYSSYGSVIMEVKNDLIVRRVTAPIARAAAERLTVSTVSLEGIDDRFKHTVDALGISAEDLTKRVERPQFSGRDQLLNMGDEYPGHAREALEKEKQTFRIRFHDQEFARFVSDLNTANKVKPIVHKHLAEMLPSNGGKYCTAYLAKLADVMQKRLAETREILKQHKAAMPTRKATESDQPFEEEEITFAQDSVRNETISALLERKIDDIDDLKTFIAELLTSWQSFCEGFNYPVDDGFASEFSQRGGRESTVDADFFENERERMQSQVVAEVLKELAPLIPNWHTVTMPVIVKEIRRISAKYWGDIMGVAHDCEDTFLHGSKYDPASRLVQYLQAAKPMWEIDEGYPLAGKIHEISAIGTVPSSPLFQMLCQSEIKLQACDDQRSDLIPIIRTQHGLSLIGLKRLAIYRQPFIQAAIDEQRWDFHLCNDRRWISTMEFPDEPESFLRDYRVFSLANMVLLVSRHEPRGYEFSAEAIPAELRPPHPFLSRREVFMFLQEHKQFAYLKQKVDAKIDEKYGSATLNSGTSGATAVEGTADSTARIFGAENYLNDIKNHMHMLRSKIDKALADYEKADRPRSERVLKADVSQIHTELRAMQSELKEQQIGI